MANLKDKIGLKIFEIISEVSANLNLKSYVVGGYVRDLIMQRPSKDIDIVTIGSGILLAENVAAKLGKGTRISVFKTFGTASLWYKQSDEIFQIEFIGARKESYSHDSRNPVVEDGTMEDDELRRDFTINSLYISLNKEDYGTLIDPFNGLEAIRNGIIRTNTNPDITFSDDPLRMMRAVRFASQLNFSLDNDTLDAIKRNAERINIITKERITEELNKIILSPKPSIGFRLLDKTGLLQYIFPEFQVLKGVEQVGDKKHKDVFWHTLKVLDNVAKRSNNLWLRWSAVLHDIAKPRCKRFEPGIGFSFHGHEVKGARMVKGIFVKMRLPQNESMRYVEKMVYLHLRPIALVEDKVTDSAVRRLLFDAGNDTDDLMLLCEADITSKNQQKVERYLQNFKIVSGKLVELEEKDRIRNFQPPISGEDIMNIFAISPCREIGIIKTAIKDAILDGKIANEREQALDLMYKEAEKLGLKRV
ncbi:MAG: CCA tRNA nucleotidyltransferase [Bacteroidales bacterium]|jgi:tRNA nucleotidyltransferase/poly(A) polymerase|nr:CCA tRNA nucleotidyltransferase [Bacteroidales bacterium]